MFFHITTPQNKCKAQPLSEPGLKLAWEEHEQKADQLYRLLVAQLELDLQFKHGFHPVCADVHANWLKVGICIAPCLALALGLPRMALSVGLVIPWVVTDALGAAP